MSTDVCVEPGPGLPVSAELVERGIPIVLGAPAIRRWLPLLRAHGYENGDLKALAVEAVLTAARDYKASAGAWSTWLVWTARRIFQATPELRNYRRRSDAGMIPAVRQSMTCSSGQELDLVDDGADQVAARHDLRLMLDRLDRLDPTVAEVLRRALAGRRVSRGALERASRVARGLLGISVKQDGADDATARAADSR